VKQQQGLTLIETLISLLLSSIIFVNAYQVISNLVQYQVRVRAADEKVNEQRLLKNVLNNIIGQSLSWEDLPARFGKKALFYGREDQLHLLSRAYASHFDRPGYRVYRLFLKQEQLWVAYRRYQRGAAREAYIERSTGIFMQNLKFSYRADANAQWLSEWPVADSLPEWMQVKAVLMNGEEFSWLGQISKR